MALTFFYCYQHPCTFAVTINCIKHYPFEIHFFSGITGVLFHLLAFMKNKIINLYISQQMPEYSWKKNKISMQT